MGFIQATNIVMWNQRFNFGFKFILCLEFLISVGTSVHIFGSKCDSDSVAAEPLSYFLNKTHYISGNILLSPQGSSIQYVRKIFRKSNISDPLIRTRTCAYQGVRNVNFGKFCVRTKWMIPKLTSLKIGGQFLMGNNYNRHFNLLFIIFSNLHI